MSGARLPYRPRLAEHAMARRHLVDGEEIVVIHDARTGNLLRMEGRIWEMIAACDGTRDIDGIALAAARAGAYRRESELLGVLRELFDSGLLADGIKPPPLPVPASTRPLDVLPDFSLVCDESGACCGFYGSIVFSPLEAARARALLPEAVRGGERAERAFLPVFGVNGRSLAVTLVNNRCAYLDEGGRCGLHMAGGEEAKPRGCRVYPASFVDDGEVVRVSVGVECPCVLASALRRSSRRLLLGRGAPLVPEGARTVEDLAPGARIVALPERIAIRPGADVARADFVAWSRALGGVRVRGDAARALWALAAAVETEGLEVSAARRALEGEGSEAPVGRAGEDMLPWVEALHAQAHGRLESATSWRSERDRSRAASAWIVEAAAALRSVEAIEGALVGPLEGGGAFVRDTEADAFYVRAAIHGHHFVDEIPLGSALRDRATRIVLSRALGPVLARVAPDDPARAFPLTLVEAMMRAHGLKAYAQDAYRLGLASAGEA